MNPGWLIFALCIIFVLGAALPLIRAQRHRNTSVLPKETLRNWRSEAQAETNTTPPNRRTIG